MSGRGERPIGDVAQFVTSKNAGAFREPAAAFVEKRNPAFKGW